MTPHIFVVSLILVLLLFIQHRMLKAPGDVRLAGSLNILIIYLLLPLSFAGMTVIADFFFEGFTDNLVWFSLIFIPLWIISVYWMSKNIALQKGMGWVRKAWLAGMNILLLMGYVCAIVSSHHEHGSTPSVTGSVYLTGYFIGIHVAVVIALAVEVWLLVKNSWNVYGTWIKLLLTVVALAIYLAILLDMTSAINF